MNKETFTKLNDYIKTHKILFSIISFVVVCIVFVVMVILFINLVQKDERLQLESPREIRVKGIVIDSDTQEPVADITVSYGENQQVLSNENGEFTIQSIMSDATLEVSGSDLFEVIRVPVDNRETITLFVSNALIDFYQSVEQFESQRKYDQLYQYLSPDLQTSYTEDAYILEKNRWFDENIRNKGYRRLEFSFKRDSFNQNENQATVTALLTRIREDGTEDVFEMTIPIVFQDGTWSLQDIITPDLP